MRVSIDGGLTWNEINEVRVEQPNAEDDDTHIVVCITSEGMIIDRWANSEAGEHVGTSCFEWEDMKEWCS